jgi:hypothetical protein
MPTTALAQGINVDVLTDLRRENESARKSDRLGFTPRDRAVISDQALSRLAGSPAPEERPNPFSPSNFKLDIVMPFSFNSNPLGTEDQTTDGHAKPDLSVLWSYQIQSLKLSLFTDVSFDRYIINGAANTDTWTSWATVAYTPEGSPWSLYFKYRPTLVYSTDFAHRTLTFHDLLGGVTGANPLTSKLTFSFDFVVGHRSAEPEVFSAALASLSASFAYKMTDEWSVTLRPSVDLSWYDNDVKGRSRHDIRPAMRVSTDWQPASFKGKPFLEDSKLNMLVSVARNISNLPNRSFTRWDVGPALVFKHQF